MLEKELYIGNNKIYIYRDLKPANVMLAGGTVKLGDFGFAKKNPNKKVQNKTSVGTPLYMSI